MKDAELGYVVQDSPYYKISGLTEFLTPFGVQPLKDITGEIISGETYKPEIEKLEEGINISLIPSDKGD